MFFVQPTGPENLFVNYLSRIHREEVRHLSSLVIIFIPNTTATVSVHASLTLFEMTMSMKSVMSAVLNLFFPPFAGL